MRSTSSRSLLALSSLLLTLPSPSAAFDCAEIQAQSVKFDLSKLGGPHIVQWSPDPDLDAQVQLNYNFTLDICNKIKWHKGGSLATECHHGARVCAIRETVDTTGVNNATINPIDIAGTYTSHSHRSIDAQFTLLRGSESNSDAAREGVRAELHGGRFPFEDSKTGVDQRAIIEFVCDRERTGLEGTRDDDGEKDDGDDDDSDDKGDDKEGDDKKEEGKRLSRRDDDHGKCVGDDKKSLRFCGYERESLPKDKVARTLRLEWRTKYACEDAPRDAPGSHWGFFTWFIIIAFLAIATYLIFGSWLNYNRYGARGWDLLPHGDTIRDIPYLFRDWARRVMGTVQGSGSRGGYSAV
ncbi:autophagy protein-like protein Atg27 [Massariosphaeria phaeospora]|uniref:Autophagy-related protein 27 n=1 Tax=Massariosphaeria phaeospora TaxID=100035 RepID=A0A7C8M1S1_9PLEO|nr:autophagy protein-like protein Atg27 [Massariosphaeria phaeospora]